MNEIKRKKRGRIIKGVLIAFAAVLALLLGAVAFMYIKWSNAQNYNSESMFTAQTPTDILEPSPSPASESAPSPTPAFSYEGTAISYNGEYYVLNENIVSVLFLGIDAEENVDYSELDTPVINSNQADTIMLAVFDTDNDTMRLINIPRDTLADVKVLDAFMHYAATEKLPIALQHAYGDGNKLSNELTMEAVSNLLFGVPVNRYLTLNISGIAQAADLVGGVPVEVRGDFSAKYPDMVPGATVNLTGNRAEMYVRGRLLEGLDGENLTRMGRQVQFAKSFISKVKEKVKADPTSLLAIYQAMSENYVTNLTLDESMFLAKKVLAANLDDGTISTPSGEAVTGGYALDDEALKALVIEVFYSKISMQG